MRVVEAQRNAGGRPREFDEGLALDGAIEAFWRLGYEGASMAELTQAMGINKPSLYAAYGSKEKLFERALQRYGECYHERLKRLLSQSSAYDVIESYLRDTAAAVRAGIAPGCLSIQGGLSCAPNNTRIPQLLSDYRGGIEHAVATALAATDALAGYAVTIGKGLAVDAAAGASQAKLDAVVDVALAGLATLLARESG